jgi:hypothetical protein
MCACSTYYVTFFHLLLITIKRTRNKRAIRLQPYFLPLLIKVPYKQGLRLTAQVHDAAAKFARLQ